MITNLVWATAQLGVSAWLVVTTAVSGPYWAYWLSMLALMVAFVAFCVAFVDYYFHAA